MKVVIVFIHNNCRFETWLAGYNKQVQEKYWKLFKDSNWDKYKIVPAIKGVDSIIEYILDDNPDFSNLKTLTDQIEKKTLRFIKDIEDFLI